MNPLEHLLKDELNRLVDRIAVATHAGTVSVTAKEHPELRTRIEDAESRLAELRQTLLAGYVEWQQAVEECEALWAVAELESDGPVARPTRARRAA
jgi:hypothetical protein